MVGKAFAGVLKEGKISRKDVWVTSKLDNPDHKPDDVRKACEKTIKDLQCEYLDEYLMHWPLTGNKGKTVEPPIKVSLDSLPPALLPCTADLVGCPSHSHTAQQDNFATSQQVLQRQVYVT